MCQCLGGGEGEVSLSPGGCAVGGSQPVAIWLREKIVQHCSDRWGCRHGTSGGVISIACSGAAAAVAICFAEAPLFRGGKELCLFALALGLALALAVGVYAHVVPGRSRMTIGPGYV